MAWPEVQCSRLLSDKNNQISIFNRKKHTLVKTAKNVFVGVQPWLSYLEGGYPAVLLCSHSRKVWAPGKPSRSGVPQLFIALFSISAAILAIPDTIPPTVSAAGVCCIACAQTHTNDCNMQQTNNHQEILARTADTIAGLLPHSPKV